MKDAGLELKSLRHKRCRSEDKIKQAEPSPSEISFQGFMKVGLLSKEEGKFYGARIIRSLKGLSRANLMESLKSLTLLTGEFPHTEKPIKNEDIYLRYVGHIDLDVDDVGLDMVKNGTKAFFKTVPAEPLPKDKFKKLVKEVLSKEDYMLENYVQDSELFREAKNKTEYICCLLRAGGLECEAFFTGCKGFRIFWYDEKMWVRVSHDVAYSQSVLNHMDSYFKDLEEKLEHETLPENLKDLHWESRWLDPSVYDPNKGLKPDVLRHHETGIYSRTINSSKPLSYGHPDREVLKIIEKHWSKVISEQERLYDTSWESFPLMQYDLSSVGSTKPAKNNEQNPTRQQESRMANLEELAILQTAVNRRDPRYGKIKQAYKVNHSDHGMEKPCWNVNYYNPFCPGRGANGSDHTGRNQTMLQFYLDKTIPYCQNKSCLKSYYFKNKKNFEAWLTIEEAQKLFPELNLEACPESDEEAEQYLGIIAPKGLVDLMENETPPSNGPKETLAVSQPEIPNQKAIMEAIQAATDRKTQGACGKITEIKLKDGSLEVHYSSLYCCCINETHPPKTQKAILYFAPTHCTSLPRERP